MEDERRMKHNFTLARLCQNNLMVLFDSCCISEKCVGFVFFFSFFFLFPKTQALYNISGVRFLVQEGKCLYHCKEHWCSFAGNLSMFPVPHVQDR